MVIAALMGKVAVAVVVVLDADADGVAALPVSVEVMLNTCVPVAPETLAPEH